MKKSKPPKNLPKFHQTGANMIWSFRGKCCRFRIREKKCDELINSHYAFTHKKVFDLVDPEDFTSRPKDHPMKNVPTACKNKKGTGQFFYLDSTVGKTLKQFAFFSFPPINERMNLSKFGKYFVHF